LALEQLALRASWLKALESLELAWRSDASRDAPQGLSRAELSERWAEVTRDEPSASLLSALERAFASAAWAPSLSLSQRSALLLGRQALFERVRADLRARVLPAERRWSPPAQLSALPQALALSIARLGVSVLDAHGEPIICAPKEAQRSLREALEALGALTRSSIDAGRPMSLRARGQDGAPFETLALCLFNCPSALLVELKPSYRPLLAESPLMSLSAHPASSLDDLCFKRDLSLSRAADPSRGLQKARGWLQLGLSPLATEAERKAREARVKGRAHTITPHHLAFSCPATHPLWATYDHRPRSHEGRARAIRELLRRAASTPVQLDRGLAASSPLAPLLVPVLALPAALGWQLCLDAQTLIARPLKGSPPRG